MYFSKVFGRPRILVPALIFCYALLFFQLPVRAVQSVPLAWDPSSDPNVAGYRVYYGVESGTYIVSVDVGNVTQTTITGLAEGTTYYFAATAYDNAGNESNFSNEATYQTPAFSIVPYVATGPGSSAMTKNVPALTSADLSGGKFEFNVSGTTGSVFVVQTSTNLIDWIPVQTNAAKFTFTDTNTAGFKQRFYRVISAPPPNVAKLPDAAE